MVEQTAESVFQRALACERAAIRADRENPNYYWRDKYEYINLERHWRKLTIFFRLEADLLLKEAVALA